MRPRKVADFRCLTQIVHNILRRVTDSRSTAGIHARVDPDAGYIIKTIFSPKTVGGDIVDGGGGK